MSRKLYDQIEVRELPSVKYLPRPTPEQLDEFESRQGLKLPKSFRVCKHSVNRSILHPRVAARTVSLGGLVMP
jgi:hypothetical protein